MADEDEIIPGREEPTRVPVKGHQKKEEGVFARHLPAPASSAPRGASLSEWLESPRDDGMQAIEISS